MINFLKNAIKWLIPAIAIGAAAVLSAALFLLAISEPLL